VNESSESESPSAAEFIDELNIVKKENKELRAKVKALEEELKHEKRRNKALEAQISTLRKRANSTRERKKVINEIRCILRKTFSDGQIACLLNNVKNSVAARGYDNCVIDLEFVTENVFVFAQEVSFSTSKCEYHSSLVSFFKM